MSVQSKFYRNDSDLVLNHYVLKTWKTVKRVTGHSETIYSYLDNVNLTIFVYEKIIVNVSRLIRFRKYGTN
jgi:hypothetical protein